MKKILITAPICQNIKIFKEYLWSINRLEIPEGYEVHKYFYLYDSDNLKKLLKSNEFVSFKNDFNLPKDNIIPAIRTKILEYARKNKFDYIFNVDDNIILHQKTLVDLVERKKDIISKIYWIPTNEKEPWNCTPNCFDGFIRDKKIIKDNLIHYKFIGTYEIGATYGIMLISSKIFNEPLLNYYPINILSPSILEEYSFCVKCKCFFPDLKIYIDTVHPAKYLKTEEDYDNWIKWEKLEWK